METTDPEDADKFQFTTDMFLKMLVKFMELVGTVEYATREVLVLLMALYHPMMDDTMLSFVLFLSLFRLKSHEFVIVK
jgi:hypothetical protein